MKKISLLILACFVMFFCMNCFAKADSVVKEVPETKIIINGKEIEYSDVPISINGRTLLPLRELLTNLGIENDAEHVVWNEAENSVTIYKDAIKVYLKIGDSNATVNGTAVQWDTAPVIYKDKVYVPVWFASKSFGKIVAWSEALSTVKITDANSEKVKPATTPKPISTPAPKPSPDSWTTLTDRPDGNEPQAYSMPGNTSAANAGTASISLGLKSRLVTGSLTFNALIVKSNDMNKAVTIGNKMYMIDNDGQVEEYDISSDTWADKGQIAALKDSRGFFKLAAIDGKIYIVGANLTDILEYDPQSRQCTLKTKLPKERFVGAAIAVDGKIYILGGLNRGEFATLNTLEMYDPILDQWTDKKGPSEGAINVIVASLDGKIYMMGSMNGKSGQSFEEYDIQTDTWAKRTPASPDWSVAGMEVVNGKIYTFGYGNTESRWAKAYNVKEYDPAAQTWSTRASMDIKNEGFATAVYNGEIYLISGAAVEKYTPPDPNNPTASDPNPSRFDKAVTEQIRARLKSFSGAKDLLDGKTLDFSERSIFAISKALAGFDSGKHYFELKLGKGGKRISPWTNAGIASIDGKDFNRASEDSSRDGYTYGVINNWGRNGIIEGKSLKDGDIIGIAMDLDNGKLYVSLNGEWKNGVPNSNEGLAIEKSVEYYAGVSCGGNGLEGVGDSWVPNFGSAPFAYSMPEGYSPYSKQP